MRGLTWWGRDLLRAGDFSCTRVGVDRRRCTHGRFVIDRLRQDQFSKLLSGNPDLKT